MSARKRTSTSSALERPKFDKQTTAKTPIDQQVIFSSGTGPASSDPIGNPFANIETIVPRLREDEKTSKFLDDPSFMDMLTELGKNPLNMQKYLNDDRLRLTLSALLGFELEHPDKMNFNEPPFVNDSDDDDENAKVHESKINTTEQAKKFKELGTECLKKKEYAKAIEQYDRAIELDATDLSFYSNKALAYQFLHQSHGVRETSLVLVDVWKKCGGDKTIVAKAFRRIGQSFMDENKFGDALKYFELSLEQNKLDETKKLAGKCQEQIPSSDSI